MMNRHDRRAAAKRRNTMTTKHINEFMSSPAGNGPARVVALANPLIVMFENDDGTTTCHIHPRKGYDHLAYGLLICDMVRNIADAFKVDENDVWEWVDKERHHHTTDIMHPS